MTSHRLAYDNTILDIYIDSRVVKNSLPVKLLEVLTTNKPKMIIYTKLVLIGFCRRFTEQSTNSWLQNSGTNLSILSDISSECS